MLIIHFKVLNILEVFLIRKKKSSTALTISLPCIGQTFLNLLCLTHGAFTFLSNTCKVGKNIQWLLHLVSIVFYLNFRFPKCFVIISKSDSHIYLCNMFYFSYSNSNLLLKSSTIVHNLVFYVIGNSIFSINIFYDIW